MASKTLTTSLASLALTALLVTSVPSTALAAPAEDAAVAATVSVDNAVEAIEIPFPQPIAQGEEISDIILPEEINFTWDPRITRAAVIFPNEDKVTFYLKAYANPGYVFPDGETAASIDATYNRPAIEMSEPTIRWENVSVTPEGVISGTAFLVLDPNADLTYTMLDMDWEPTTTHGQYTRTFQRDYRLPSGVRATVEVSAPAGFYVKHYNEYENTHFGDGRFEAHGQLPFVCETDGVVFFPRPGTFDCSNAPTPPPTTNPETPKPPTAETGGGEQLPPSAGGKISVADTATAGAFLDLNVGVAYAGHEVDAVLYSDPISLGRHTVDANGFIRVALPAGVTGSHRVAVYDLAGNLIGWDSITINAAVVAAADKKHELASTGAAENLALLGAGALLVGGAAAALMSSARRRKVA